MSYIKEYQMGAISYEEYQFLANRENRIDRDDMEDDWEDEDSEGGLIDDE